MLFDLNKTVNSLSPGIIEEKLRHCRFDEHNIHLLIIYFKTAYNILQRRRHFRQKNKPSRTSSLGPLWTNNFPYIYNDSHLLNLLIISRVSLKIGFWPTNWVFENPENTDCLKTPCQQALQNLIF